MSSPAPKRDGGILTRLGRAVRAFKSAWSRSGHEAASPLDWAGRSYQVWFYETPPPKSDALETIEVGERFGRGVFRLVRLFEDD